LLICALGLSGTAAYYSVVGLSVVFVGVAIPVIIMGSFLEISKIAIATYLHDKWKETYGALKIYMTIALITLSVITSLGIYGLLSTGFQGNIAKLEINEKKIKNVEVKKERFNEIKEELSKEKTTLDKDITQLRQGLSTNTTTQSVDRRTGQLITRANNANRTSFLSQLKDAQTRRDTLSSKIDALNDSITKIDIQILDMESEEISGSELGAIKYLSEVLQWDIKRTANLFILILIFVFDPLAITLVIATNQAFKSKRKDDETPQVPPNNPPSTDQVTTKYRLSNDEVIDEKNVEKLTDLQKEVNKVWEKVNQLKEEGKLPPPPTEEELAEEPTALAFTYGIEEEPEEVIDEDIEEIKIPTQTKKYEESIDDYFEREDFNELNITEPKEETKQPEVIQYEVPTEPKRLSYTNRNGGSFRINRI
jgi:hypothetical protein